MVDYKEDGPMAAIDARIEQMKILAQEIRDIFDEEYPRAYIERIKKCLEDE